MNKLSEKNKRGKVLVLGTDFKNYRSCLTVIRSLGRKGLKVHLAWNSIDDIARHSKYVAAIHEIPAYSPDNSFWKTKLIELITREQFDFVVPCNEQSSAPLEANRRDFEKFPSVYLLNKEAYEIAFDKFKSNHLAKSLGIALPREKRVSDLAEMDDIVNEFQFPIVLKPSVSFNLESLNRKNYVYKAYSPKELKTSLRHLLKNGDVLIQENFLGTGVGIEFIADKGELLFAFQHIRLHEPLMGGGSSYRKSAPCHPELLEASRKLIKALNYTGVGMAEFKFNFAAGKWIFLEVNGRFWGSIPLAVSAGADFPYFLYQLKVENKREFPQKYRTNLYVRNTIRDFIWIIENASVDKSDLSRNTLPNTQVAKELLRFATFREKNDTWSMDDLKPGMLELKRLTNIAIDKLKQAFLTYSPLRYLRSFKARHAFRKAKSVLIVCFGNIYRSPFAERYAKSRLPDSITIESAGYFPKSGRRCHQRAVDIAAEFGIDMADHSSKIIDEKMVQEADLILTFDQENRRTLVDMFPSTRHKIHYLGLLLYKGPVVIDDPVEGNLYTVRNTYRAIKNAIDSYTGLL